MVFNLFVVFLLSSECHLEKTDWSLHSLVENSLEDNIHSQACFLIGVNSVCTEIHSQLAWFGDDDCTVGFKCLLVLKHKSH